MEFRNRIGYARSGSVWIRVERCCSCDAINAIRVDFDASAKAEYTLHACEVDVERLFSLDENERYVGVTILQRALARRGVELAIQDVYYRRPVAAFCKNACDKWA